MKTIGGNGALLAVLITAVHAGAVGAVQRPAVPSVREGRIPIGPASLYVRDVGRGAPVIVLHGGPDFDHRYLLPEMDRWAERFHLIYYDQRGRGSSARAVRPADVSLASDLDDLDRVRRHFGLGAPVVLGHSWGTLLALEYALRHPRRVSRLILMNPAPASAADYALLRKSYIELLGPDLDRQREIVDGRAYQAGDPAAVAERYRLHFKPALAHPEHFEKLMARMKAAFFAQGREGILEARAVEHRLMQDTWDRDDYDLLARVAELRVPTLVISGSHDFIPAEIARHIARAMPRARLVTIERCGHFSYLECPDKVREAVDAFMPRPAIAP